jgi:NTP pyrophosphatase (non-canonical NTP hydrolase)
MKDRQGELLVILAEECAEVAQVIAKCLRFGMDDCHPDKPGTPNKVRLETEIGDLMAMVHILTEEGHLDPIMMADARIAKRIKVEKFMKHGKP